MIAAVGPQHFSNRSLPVDQPQHVVLLVRHLAKALAKHFSIDLENRIERGQQLRQAAPFVEPSHSLHEQRLRRAVHRTLAQTHAAELEIEGALPPQELPVNRVFTAQVLDGRVDDRARIERNHALLSVGRDQRQHTGLPADVDRLQ